jgi:cytochrome P450
MVERRADLFSSDSAYRINESPGESNMIASDDPVHLHQRRLVNRRFTPAAVSAQSDTLARMIDDLVDQPGSGRGERDQAAVGARKCRVRVAGGALAVHVDAHEERFGRPQRADGVGRTCC